MLLCDIARNKKRTYIKIIIIRLFLYVLTLAIKNSELTVVIKNVLKKRIAMNIGKFILIGIIASNISYAMDGPKAIIPSISKEDSKKLVPKKKSKVLEKPTKSIIDEPTTPEKSSRLSKQIAVEPYERRIHIKDLFSVIPFNGEKKQLNEWIITKDEKFGQIECLSFSRSKFAYSGTVKDFTFDFLYSLPLGRGFYYSNSNLQIDVIGIWDGPPINDHDKYGENLNKRPYLSLLLSYYMLHKGLLPRKVIKSHF